MDLTLSSSVGCEASEPAPEAKDYASLMHETVRTKGVGRFLQKNVVVGGAVFWLEFQLRPHWAFSPTESIKRAECLSVEGA